MRQQFHWKRRKQSDEDGPGIRGNLPGIVITRRMSLRDGEMRVILMVKGMANLKKALEVDRDKTMAKENMELIANPRNRVQQEDVAQEHIISVQTPRFQRPQR